MIHNDSLLKVWLANSPAANRKWHKFKEMSQWNDPKGWFCFRLSYVFVNNDDSYTECNLTWWMIDGWLVLSLDVLVLKDHVAIGYNELERNATSNIVNHYGHTNQMFWKGVFYGILVFRDPCTDIFFWHRNAEVGDLFTWGLFLPYTLVKTPAERMLWTRTKELHHFANRGWTWFPDMHEMLWNKRQGSPPPKRLTIKCITSCGCEWTELFFWMSFLEMFGKFSPLKREP